MIGGETEMKKSMREGACGVKSEKSPKMCKILAKNRRKCAKFAKMCKFAQKCAFLVNFTLFRRIFAQF